MARPPKPVDVELTILSARDLKNVNWRYGDLRPYVVAWVDPDYKVSTRVDSEGDTNPSWDEKLTIPVGKRPLEESELTIEVVHEKPSELTKPLVGTVRIPLVQVLDEVGFEERLERTLKLKRPSGRPQGKLETQIRLREKRWPEPQYPQAYESRGYNPNYPSYPSPQYPYANPPAGYPNPPAGYANAPAGYAPPPAGYAKPPAGYPYPYQPPNPYAQPNPYAPPNPYAGSNSSPYGGSYYNEVPPVGSSAGGYSAATAPPAPYYGQPEKPSSKFGLGTGLAVGAVAGALGGLALGEAIDYGEDKIEDRVAERVEDNLGYEDDYGGGDDDY